MGITKQCILGETYMSVLWVRCIWYQQWLKVLFNTEKSQLFIYEIRQRALIYGMDAFLWDIMAKINCKTSVTLSICRKMIFGIHGFSGICENLPGVLYSLFRSFRVTVASALPHQILSNRCVSSLILHILKCALTHNTIPILIIILLWRVEWSSIY